MDDSSNIFTVTEAERVVIHCIYRCGISWIKIPIAQWNFCRITGSFSWDRRRHWSTGSWNLTRRLSSYSRSQILRLNHVPSLCMLFSLKNNTSKLGTIFSLNIWLLLWDEILLVRFQEPVDQCLPPFLLKLPVNLQNFHWEIGVFIQPIYTNQLNFAWSSCNPISNVTRQKFHQPTKTCFQLWIYI